MGPNGPDASRGHPCQKCKNTGLSALALSVCYNFSEMILNLQNSHPIRSPLRPPFKMQIGWLPVCLSWSFI